MLTSTWLPTGLTAAFAAIASLVAAVDPPGVFGPRWEVQRHVQEPHVSTRQGTVDVWRLRRLVGRGAPVTLVFAILPEANNRASVAYINRRGAAPSVYAPGFCPGAIAVVNANFYQNDSSGSRPLGLLRVGGREITPASRRRTGGFLIVDARGRVEVLLRTQAAEALAASDALESTPVIVFAGRDAMRGDQGDRFDRVAVGQAADGATILVGAFAEDQKTVSLAEFSQLVLAAASFRNVGLEGALAMDGGPSAHLWFPRAAALYGDRGPAYLPSAICVTPR